MKKLAESRNREYTEVWRQHSIDTWRELNLIREELKLPLVPIPEILNLSTREIISKVLSEIGDEKSEFTREESPEELTYEIFGKKTDKLHKLQTGHMQSSFLIRKSVAIVTFDSIKNSTRSMADAQYVEQK